MKHIYFLTPIKAVILDWDGVSEEPQHIARFDYLGSDFSDRYVLHDGNIIDKYLGMTDTQAMIAEQAVMTVAAPVIPQGFVPAPIEKTNLIHPITLKLKFTIQERVEIYACTDPFIVDFLRILDDQRLSIIDKLLPATQEAFERLVELGLVEESRKLEILA